MGCYLIITNRLCLGKSGELSTEKASGCAAKAFSKMVQELVTAKYRITF